jgi:hypothetical protein
LHWTSKAHVFLLAATYGIFHLRGTKPFLSGGLLTKWCNYVCWLLLRLMGSKKNDHGLLCTASCITTGFESGKWGHNYFFAERLSICVVCYLVFWLSEPRAFNYQSNLRYLIFPTHVFDTSFFS